MTNKQVIEMTKHFLNKLITENDSLFILTILNKSNFDIKKEDNNYLVKITHISNNEEFKVNAIFNQEQIEININEKTNNLFNDKEITDSNCTKERYAYYELLGDEVYLRYKQKYTYTITNQNNETTTMSPVNVEENCILEFTKGEPNLLENYQNIKMKHLGKKLTLN